jgi:virulence factor Mce-like protein
MNRARLTPILIGVAVLVVAILLLTGGGNEYIVKAELANAGGLRKNASVKVAGVPAGKVKKVEITGRDTALATLVLDKEAAPIGADAKIQIRPTDLLGERYADMDTGDTSRPQPSGTLIPLKNTSDPVELDDVLNMLDADTRTRVRILVNEFGIGLGARGKDFNQLLVELPPAVDKSKALLGEVAAENVKLKALIDQGDRITATIHGRRDKLGELVKQASAGLRAVAARRQALGATVANAPGALTQLRATLTRLDSASQSLRPAAADLRRAAPPLTATLRALPAFANSAKGTLARARSVSPSLRRLGVGATPTVKRLQPTSGLLKDVGTEATPSLAQLDRRGMEDLLQFVQGWARGMKGRDNLGHFIGALAIGNEQALLSAVDSYVSGLSTTTNAGARRHVARVTPKLTLPKLPAVPSAGKLKLKLPKVPLDIPKVTQQVQELSGALSQKLRQIIGRAQPGQQAPRQGRQSSGSDALRLFDYLFGS